MSAPTRKVSGRSRPATASQMTSTIVWTAIPPIRFPAARSRFPCAAADTVIASSGRVPAIASRMIPPSSSPRPSLASSASVVLERLIPAAHVATAPATNTTTSHGGGETDMTHRFRRDHRVILRAARVAARIAPMADSPFDRLLAAVDTLDVDAVLALMTPNARLLMVDGRRAQGTAAIRELLSDFVAPLRSTTHRVTADWHEDNVWIAEVDATYERTDGLQTGTLARVIVLRERTDGIADMRAFGAQTPLLTDPRGDEQGGLRLGGRWIPPL